jgi:hypothetical protein
MNGVRPGSEYGYNTVRLTHWAAAHRAVVHAIDPQPLFDVEALQRRYSKALAMYPTVSLEALPAIKRPDVVLIDGDHNWYTVFHELELVDCLSRTWPLTCLHDVAGVYGRRDMYYAPLLIPPEYRQPYERSGIVEGRSQLSPRGRNAGLANAAHEGGPRNGVLTAIEDFMKQTKRSLELFIVQGPEGLAVLVDRDRLKTKVGDVIERIHAPVLALELSPDYASRYFDVT